MDSPDIIARRPLVGIRARLATEVADAPRNTARSRTQSRSEVTTSSRTSTAERVEGRVLRLADLRELLDSSWKMPLSCFRWSAVIE